MPKQQQLSLYSTCDITGKAVVKNELLVEKLEDFLARHTNLYFPHDHQFYQFVLFTGGRGGYSIDFVNFPVEIGHAYFMVPGQVHSWNFDNVKGYIINFSGRFLQSFVSIPRYLEKFSVLSGYVPEKDIDLSHDQGLPKILDQMIPGAGKAGELKNDRIKVELLRLIIDIEDRLERPGLTKNKRKQIELVQNFKQLIGHHYLGHRPVSAYAKELSITTNHLNTLCRKVTGQTAGDLVRERLVLEAKRLLINSRVTILEISNKLNFIDNSYFSKFFKKHTGLTPEKFRSDILPHYIG
ncbi:MAG TPA: helix-turn-helix transcriptional regulator [Ferruginibacter sp.]|nr:helix-turn-helix transcriptional regulator [Ferruginibacter sp.]